MKKLFAVFVLIFAAMVFAQSPTPVPCTLQMSPQYEFSHNEFMKVGDQVTSPTGYKIKLIAIIPIQSGPDIYHKLILEIYSPEGNKIDKIQLDTSTNTIEWYGFNLDVRMCKVFSGITNSYTDVHFGEQERPITSVCDTRLNTYPAKTTLFGKTADTIVLEATNNPTAFGIDAEKNSNKLYVLRTPVIVGRTTYPEGVNFFKKNGVDYVIGSAGQRTAFKCARDPSYAASNFYIGYEKNKEYFVSPDLSSSIKGDWINFYNNVDTPRRVYTQNYPLNSEAKETSIFFSSPRILARTYSTNPKYREATVFTTNWYYKYTNGVLSGYDIYMRPNYLTGQTFDTGVLFVKCPCTAVTVSVTTGPISSTGPLNVSPSFGPFKPAPVKGDQGNSNLGLTIGGIFAIGLIGWLFMKEE